MVQNIFFDMIHRPKIQIAVNFNNSQLGAFIPIWIKFKMLKSGIGQHRLHPRSAGAHDVQHKGQNQADQHREFDIHKGPNQCNAHDRSLHRDGCAKFETDLSHQPCHKRSQSGRRIKPFAADKRQAEPEAAWQSGQK
jgi:hypothetical protein